MQIFYKFIINIKNIQNLGKAFQFSFIPLYIIKLLESNNIYSICPFFEEIISNDLPIALV